MGGSQEATDEEGPKKLLVLLMDCVLPNEFDDASKKLMAGIPISFTKVIS